MKAEAMRRRPTRLVLLITLAAGLLLAAGALAARPQPGKTYRGFTSFRYRSYPAPVSFKVSSDGRQLLGFQFGEADCGGLGGLTSPWTSPDQIAKIAAITVSGSGTFSVSNARWRFPVAAGEQPKVAIATVNGTFTAAGKATGAIHYTVSIGSGTCPQAFDVTFTATTP